MKALLDPRNGRDWDLPPPADPAPRTWVVASIPRTGSTLLCNAVWDTGLVGCPKEYLNPMQLRDWEVREGSWSSRRRHAVLSGAGLLLVGRTWSRARLIAHIERVRARRTGPSGWFGLKLHHHHLRRWFPGGAPELEDVLGPIRWVSVRRQDRVAQAVSWVRATQSGQWASFQPKGRPVRYSRRQIQARLDEIARAEAAWDEAFTRTPPPLRLDYEALAGDLGGAVAAVLRHLDTPVPTELTVAPSLQRQADPLTDQWVSRFRGHDAPKGAPSSAEQATT